MRVKIKRKEIEESDDILAEIRFEFFHPYKIAAMGEPWAMKVDRTLQLLKENGIGAILTLTEDDPYGERYEAAGFIHHHEPIEDCEPPTIGAMNRIIKFINSCLAGNHAVAVHCLEGRGRTGTVLAAWVGLKESLDVPQAIERVYKARFHTVITPSQRTFLVAYLNRKNKLLKGKGKITPKTGAKHSRRNKR